MLRIGECSLSLEGFDAALLDGRCGLIAERLLYAPRRIETRLTFGDPWVAIPPAAAAPSVQRVSR